MKANLNLIIQAIYLNYKIISHASKEILVKAGVIFFLHFGSSRLNNKAFFQVRYKDWILVQMYMKLKVICIYTYINLHNTDLSVQVLFASEFPSGK